MLAFACVIVTSTFLIDLVHADPTLTLFKDKKPIASLAHQHHRHRVYSTLLHVRGGGITNDSSTAVTPLHHAVRGGGEIDKSTTVSWEDIGAKEFTYVGIQGSILLAIVLFCRNASRTGGHAPSWVTNWIASDAYATPAMHLIFWGIGLLLPTILPPGLSRVIFSPPSVALLGTVFPAVESVRAAVTDSGSDDRTWLMYWVIHGIFQYSTEFMDQLAMKYDIVYKYWHTFEVLAIIWLVLPTTDGATLIYKAIAQPYLVPIMQPIKNMADSWISALALTTINAGYICWFSFVFMSLPVMVKRNAVMAVGSMRLVGQGSVKLGAGSNRHLTNDTVRLIK